MIQKLHSNTVSLDFLHCEILHSPSYLLHHFDQFLLIELHWLQRREGFCFINSRKFYKHRSFECTFQIFSHDDINNLTKTLKKKIETHEQLYNHVTKELAINPLAFQKVTILFPLTVASNAIITWFNAGAFNQGQRLFHNNSLAKITVNNFFTQKLIIGFSVALFLNKLPRILLIIKLFPTYMIFNKYIPYYCASVQPIDHRWYQNVGRLKK